MIIKYFPWILFLLPLLISNKKEEEFFLVIAVKGGGGVVNKTVKNFTAITPCLYSLFFISFSH